jgi:hypothetical protein
LLFKYLSIYVRPNDKMVEIDPVGHPESMSTNATVFFSNQELPNAYDGFQHIGTLDELKIYAPDYMFLNGNIHYRKDICSFLKQLHAVCSPGTRLIITYYSRLWQPFFRLATMLGLRRKDSEQNWLAMGDVQNLLELADFEPIIDESRVLMPLYIPIVSNLLNRYLSPLPLFRACNMLHIMVARPLFDTSDWRPSVSVVVPARNESGNIESAVTRLPAMGPDDELIFVEGNSVDNTWGVIQQVKNKYSEKNIVIARQDGKGKGDAVRKGFSLASKEILMILDADLTVPPENLPMFYEAIVQGKGEFINGSRLVYPMDNKAMRFANIVGNKFFAVAFSFVLGQRFKDTLCGTKVLTRENYNKIASHRGFFGEFDPFGDFDLIFGSMRLALKIREVPISYKERVYGNTNIQRWRHGVILLRMLIFAAHKIKFV